jgi:hypothetical protein
MKKIFNLLLILFLICTAGETFAQDFLPRIQAYSPKKESTVILKDGTEVKGFYKGAKLKNGLMTRVTFEQENGEKRKIEASEIAQMYLYPSKLGSLSAFSEANASIVKASNSNYDEVYRKDAIIFEQAKLPGKKGKYVMLQLINPHFSEKLKVYDNPTAKTSGGWEARGVQITGGELKSFYVIIDGVVTEVKKKNYKQMFATFFSDCPEMNEVYEKKKVQDFGKHVYFYHNSCK